MIALPIGIGSGLTLAQEFYMLISQALAYSSSGAHGTSGGGLALLCLLGAGGVILLLMKIRKELREPKSGRGS